MRILVTGGCGYVGSVLVPKLLALGHKVTVVDIQWFGNYLQPHPNLRVVIADIRVWDGPIIDDVVIHLAGIANDPDCLLDAKVSWETNVLATMRLMEMTPEDSRFIYASSGSVYGVNDSPQVTEDTPLNPISDYNKTKMIAERVLLSYNRNLCILRPGTVCGYSPRMRLDTTVNMHTMQALTSSLMTIPSPYRLRPHIHIEDMTNAYVWMVDHPSLIGIYNCGFVNLSIRTVSEIISKHIECVTEVMDTSDPRSYRLNSDKLTSTGFTFTHSIRSAILDLIDKHREGVLVDNPKWHTLSAMPR